MTESRGSDRRTGIRTDLLLKVEYQQSADLVADYITDLADGGLFLRSDLPFEIGQHLQFQVSFPGLLAPLNLSGIVRWRRQRTLGRWDEPAGVGVEFVFASERERQAVRAVNDSLREKLNAVPSRKMRVLLVDDNEVVRELFLYAVRKFYEQSEFQKNLEIVVAWDGKAGWEQLQAGPIDFAIIDHFLPVMSGGDLLRRMRQHPRFQKIPVVMISGGGNEIREEVMKAGADLYLEKPVVLKQLMATLRILMSRDDMRKATTLFTPHAQS